MYAPYFGNNMSPGLSYSNWLRVCTPSALRIHHLLLLAVPASFAIPCLLKCCAKSQGTVWPRFRMWAETGRQSQRAPQCPVAKHLPFLSAHRVSAPLQKRTAPTSGTSTQERARKSLNSPLRRVRPLEAGEAGSSSCHRLLSHRRHLAETCCLLLRMKSSCRLCPVTSLHTRGGSLPRMQSTFVGIRDSG